MRPDPAGPGAVPCLVFLPGNGFGGHETMLVEWLRAATAAGLQPTVLCRHNPPLLQLCAAAQLATEVAAYPNGAQIDGVQIHGLVDRLRELLAGWRALRAQRRTLPVLIAPGMVQASPQHLLAALLLRRRVACYVPMAYSASQMGLSWPRLRDGIMRRLAARVALWITITPQHAGLLRTVWRVAAPIVVVPNHLALLRSAAVPRTERAAGAPLRARFIGRFERHHKGLDWLAQVLRGQALPWLEMTFQGQGEYAPQLQRLAEELGAPAVTVLPWGDVGRGLQDTDVVLFASRYEGLPLVALEALHRGVAVLASRQSGLGDLLEPDCLYELGDADALVRALERLRDPGARTAAAAAAAARLRHLLAEQAFGAGVQAAVHGIAALNGRPAC